MVLCLGELLLRISPSVIREEEKHPMLLFVGGAEANVATALAGWDLPVRYMTALPDNFMSHHVLRYLSVKGIDTSPILFSGRRIGLYYLETGADLKGGVVYDRERSSFSELKRGMVDWDTVFNGVTWFHFTAISPALSEPVADVCLEALEAAAKRNIVISVDLNYRSKLWQYGKKPLDVMPQLVQYCHVVMGNIWSANTLLDTPLDEHIHDKKSTQAYLDHAQVTSLQIMQRFPRCTSVANTFRFDSEADHIRYYTTLLTGGQFYQSPEFRCTGVVDRSGSGDCFMAGLIYGFSTRPGEPQEILNYAAAAAFGKLQEQGDATGQDTLTVERYNR